MSQPAAADESVLSEIVAGRGLAVLRDSDGVSPELPSSLLSEIGQALREAKP